jgi:Glycosyl transferase family 2
VGGRTAVLIVNGFSPRTPAARIEAIRFPWVALCLREVARRSNGANVETIVWDNSGLPEHQPILRLADRVYRWPIERARGFQVSHARALDELVARTDDDVEYLVTLDTDAVPVADEWIETMTRHLDDGASVVGVWRDEMEPTVRPYVHPSCMCVHREEMIASGFKFSTGVGEEPGQRLTEEFERRGGRVVGLRRSNAVNAHFLMGGLYGDLVYHHGAGSRPARFYTSTDPAADERIRRLLRSTVFSDFDHVVAVLRGETVNDLW